MADSHPYCRKWRGTKDSLDEGERKEWKSWLKAQYSENTSWQRDWETVTDFLFLGSEITADSDCGQEKCLLLEVKLWPT